MPIDKYIDIELLFIGEINVRKEVYKNNDLTNLKNNIKKNGLLSPLLVIPVDEKYEIIAGQRRYLAMQQLKIKTVQCKVYPNDTDIEQLKLISLSENIHRLKMSNIDKMNSYYEMYILLDKDMKKASNNIGITKNTLKQYITIKEHIDPNLIKHIDSKKEKITLKNMEQIALKTKDYSLQKIYIDNLLNGIDPFKTKAIKVIKPNIKYDKIECFIPDINNIGTYLPIPEACYNDIYNIIEKYNKK